MTRSQLSSQLGYRMLNRWIYAQPESTHLEASPRSFLPPPAFPARPPSSISSQSPLRAQRPVWMHAGATFRPLDLLCFPECQPPVNYDRLQ